MNCRAGFSRRRSSRLCKKSKLEALNRPFPQASRARDRHLPYRYNQAVVKCPAVFLIMLWLLCPCLRGDDNAALGRAAAGQTIVIIPFENISPTPGLEWLGESFPEAFYERLDSPILYVASRAERLRAYDRQGIPAGVHASRATLYRLAEQMDIDYAVLGSYKYDGVQLTATAQ